MIERGFVHVVYGGDGNHIPFSQLQIHLSQEGGIKLRTLAKGEGRVFWNVDEIPKVLILSGSNRGAGESGGITVMDVRIANDQTLSRVGGANYFFS